MNILPTCMLCIALSYFPLALMADTSTHRASATPNEFVKLFNTSSSHAHTWKGIGRLRGPNSSYCTASLLDTRGESEDTQTAPAYIITSQRCFNSNNDGQYMPPSALQKHASTHGNVYFNHFQDTLGNTKEYALKEITWQSDNDLNIVIIELNETLSNLINAGIQPLKIAPHTPPTGTEIISLGIPHSSNLYATHCTQLNPVDIFSHPWVNNNLLANRCEALTTGGRGGPVLNKANNELISLIVASTHGADQDDKCLENTPCEIKDNATHWSPDTHYSLPLSFLNPCFSDGIFASSSTACTLNTQIPVSLERPNDLPVRLLERTTLDKPLEPETFKITVAHDAPFLRYKYAHDTQACTSGHEYSQPLENKNNIINFTLDESTGMHLLCITGLMAKKAKPGDSVFEKIIAIERLTASSSLPPKIKTYNNNFPELFSGHPGLSYGVTWTHTSNFHEHYEYKYGPYESIDCLAPDGYKPVVDMALWLTSLLSSGTVDANIYSGTDLTPPITKRIMGKLNGTKSSIHITYTGKILTLCTLSYNRENASSAPHTYLFKPR